MRKLTLLLGATAIVISGAAGAVAESRTYTGSATLQHLRRGGSPVITRGQAQVSYDDESGSLDLAITAIGDPLLSGSGLAVSGAKNAIIGIAGVSYLEFGGTVTVSGRISRDGKRMRLDVNGGLADTSPDPRDALALLTGRIKVRIPPVRAAEGVRRRR